MVEVCVKSLRGLVIWEALRLADSSGTSWVDALFAHWTKMDALTSCSRANRIYGVLACMFVERSPTLNLILSRIA
jgi:hypothetical protein